MEITARLNGIDRIPALKLNEKKSFIYFVPGHFLIKYLYVFLNRKPNG